MLKFILLGFSLYLSTLNVYADTLIGKVVKITDGDTVHVLDSSYTKHKIRLAGIDAPERRQAFGKRSKQYLSSLVARKTVTEDWKKHDRYGRVVGKIIYDNQDINLAMVKAGLAWWYRKYAREQSLADQAIYERAEDIAKDKRHGLWANSGSIPPWEWRRKK